MARGVGYIRKSDKERGDEQPLETQRQVVEEWFLRQGHQLVGIYEDPNCRNVVPVAEREAGGRLMRDAARGLFDFVVFYRLDRWGRLRDVAWPAFRVLHSLDVGFKSLTETFDFVTKEGRAMLGMLLVFAELERDTIEQRTTDGMRRRAKSGLACGGVTPYGYTEEAGNYFLDPEEAQVVRWIFEWFVHERLGSQRIAARLNERGIPAACRNSGKGKMRNHVANASGFWRPGQVRHVLKNPLYKGTGIYGKTKTDHDGRRKPTKSDAHIPQPRPPIVSPETWTRAQELLVENRELSPRNAKYEWLLRGRVKCALCGHTFVGMLGRARKGETKKPRYYGCYGRTHSGKAFGTENRRCPAPYVPADWLETDLWKTLLDLVTHPAAALAKVQTQWQEQADNLGPLIDERDGIARTLDRKAVARRRTIEFLTDGTLTREEANQRLEDLRTEETALREQLETLDRRMTVLAHQQQRLTAAGEFLATLEEGLDHPLPFEKKQHLVSLLVDRIEIREEAGQIVAKYQVCLAPTEERMAGPIDSNWSIALDARRAA